MKRKTSIQLAVGAVAILALLGWTFAPRPVEVEVAKVQQSHFETSIDEDAKTRLSDRYVVSAPLAGLLNRVTLREGDPVEANAIVATLTPALSPLLDARSLREQQARLETTQAQLQRAAARVERAKVPLLQAANELRRNEQLGKDGFISPTKVESDRLAENAAQRELDAAIQDHHAASHEVEQARAALMTVQAPRRSAARTFVLRAPTAGRVLRVSQTSETAVMLGTPVLELGDTRRLEVVAELLTTDALQAKPGSRVVIERWGGSKPLEGRVRLVEPAAFTKVSALGVEEQRVKVLVDIVSPPEQWRSLGDGFRVSVRIVTRAVDQATTVSTSAMFPLASSAGAPGGSDRMAVFAVSDGRARLLPIEVVARNASDAWVRHGLQAGQTVILYPSSAVKDGGRVKVRDVR